MTPPRRGSTTPISAPDLTGPTSIVDWPTTHAGTKRRGPAKPFRHLHLEVDLHHEVVREVRIPVLSQLEGLLKEREIVEVGDLLRLTAGALHGLSAAGFVHVDHWEVDPGGWLPLPEPHHERIEEPVSHLLRALASPAWRSLAEARSFAVRLSGSGGNRVDLTLRRVHRERRHSLSIDLYGSVTRAQLHDFVGALRKHLPVLRTMVTAYAYD